MNDEFDVRRQSCTDARRSRGLGHQMMRAFARKDTDSVVTRRKRGIVALNVERPFRPRSLVASRMAAGDGGSSILAEPLRAGRSYGR